MFNPNNAGVPNGSYFALPCAAEAALTLMSAEWDVTASYRAGAAQAPQAIIDASAQVDLFDLQYGNIWRRGIATLPADPQIAKRSAHSRRRAVRVMEMLAKGAPDNHPAILKLAAEVNAASQWFNGRIYAAAAALLGQGKLVGLVGGDHSAPFGLLRALAERHAEFGILHIDAHADLRQKYEGFDFSHASIMHNALTHIPQAVRIVQAGVRDLCEDEYLLAQNNPRICMFDSYSIARRAFEGGTWAQTCGQIIDALPHKVYISFDIDGLSPDNCPHTGTPVPAGLSFEQAAYLLKRLNEAGRQIIGFDLCETAPSPLAEWDAIVGARMLYKLCGCILS